MKKLAFMVFIAALVLGVSLAYATGSVSSTGSWLKFSFRGVKGSGNVKTETRELPKFSAIDFGGAIEMEITAQKTQSVEIDADDNLLPLIATEVKGDTLYISNKQRINWHSPIRVRISVEDLNALDVSGASKVNASNVRSENFKLHVSGVSKVYMQGETASLTTDANGASRIEADNFKASKVNAEASGASRILVFATDSLDAGASGASNVTYSGNPKNVNKRSSGASSVSQN